MAFLASIKKRSDLRAQGVAKEADDRDPMAITDTPWIGELDPKRYAELPSGGKWMQFYDRNRVTGQWRKCQQLYRANKLNGVSNMKVSTSHHHHSSSVGVIILYCGPPDDEQGLKEIGRNILRETGYTNASKKMFYKTDTQTLANGKQGNHKFELTIPQSNFDKLKKNPTKNNKNAISNANDDYKQQHNRNAPYSREHLQSLSKSQVIDIVLQLQQITTKKPKIAPIPAPIPLMAPPFIDQNKKQYSMYDRWLRAIKELGFERIVIIKRDTLEMLASTHKRLDSKKEWSTRIRQQSVLNGRQKLVVLNWFRKQILLKKSKFRFQQNWAFPPYILNIITLHYLENIDDKQQLMDDWSDNYKPCFYFYQQKWNILLREGTDNDGYQSLVCLKGKECVIAKQFKTLWIISKVRIMAKRQMKQKYSWMNYNFSSAPQAYNAVCLQVFDSIEEEGM